MIVMKQVYISRLAGVPLIKYLEEQKYRIMPVSVYGLGNKSASGRIHVDARIATHPDIYMCQLGLWDESGLFIGDPEKLGPDYPADIIYNAVCTRSYFIHAAPFSDPDLVTAVMTWRSGSGDGNMNFVDVRQGYTRCMCLPVDNESFITSDEDIAKRLELTGAKVLCIRPGYIDLPGFNHGFIGGCGGHVYEQITDSDGSVRFQRVIVFNGNLTAHPDCEAITSFIKQRNIKPVYFDSYPLCDVGSILAVE